jgi:hypothetical protein
MSPVAGVQGIDRIYTISGRFAQRISTARQVHQEYQERGQLITARQVYQKHKERGQIATVRQVH